MNQNLNFFKTQYVEDTTKAPKVSNYNLEPSLNRIFEAAHSQLKYNPKSAVPKIPKPIADTMSQKPSVAFVTKAKNYKKKRNVDFSNIPQLKADMDLLKKYASQQVQPSDKMTFQNQQRYREVLRQKRILENMLHEHQKLQSDRDSIACEINYMRTYLDNIRNKLDMSLRKLNTKKTVSDICPGKKSGAQSRLRIVKSIASCSPNVRTSRMSGGNSGKVKLHRVAPGGQSGNISTKNKTPPCRKEPSGINANRIVRHNSPARNHTKQWVYCPRIDRTYEAMQLH